MIDAFLQGLELGFFEVGEAFSGLADDHVWRRPAEGLLSIGELAGHVAYWEAVKFAGDGGENGSELLENPIADHGFADLSRCRVKSPMIDQRFRYQPDTLATSPSRVHL